MEKYFGFRVASEDQRIAQQQATYAVQEENRDAAAVNLGRRLRRFFVPGLHTHAHIHTQELPLCGARSNRSCYPAPSPYVGEWGPRRPKRVSLSACVCVCMHRFFLSMVLGYTTKRGCRPFCVVIVGYTASGVVWTEKGLVFHLENAITMFYDGVFRSRRPGVTRPEGTDDIYIILICSMFVDDNYYEMEKLTLFNRARIRFPVN